MLRLLVLAASLVLSDLAAAAAAPRVLAWDDEVAARKLALVSGKSLVEITHMHPRKRTEPLRVKITEPLVVRALDKTPGADGKPIERPCVVPEAVKFPLILILPDESHPSGIRLLVVDDDPTGFKWGTYRFLNTTPKELVVQMEQKAVRVPNGWKPVDLNLGGETRGVGARVALAEAIEKPLYSAVWEYDANVRTLCFLVPGTDPRLSPVAFKSIPEDRQSLLLNAAPDADKADP
jgi:hypothetical protein